MRYLIPAFLLWYAISANAEILSLICEHDGGISTKTGLPNPDDREIFPIDFDLEKPAVTSPYFAKSVTTIGITVNTIIWALALPEYQEYWLYNLNRHTGHLFLKRIIEDEIYIAKGLCVKPNPLF